jgi:isopropylmalate/homocitrate/citramalate synthase
VTGAASFRTDTRAILPHLPNKIGTTEGVFMTISQTNFENNRAISIAETIATARKAAGYSLDDMAITTGLTVSELSALEDGKDVDPARLKRVAAALQLQGISSDH